MRERAWVVVLGVVAALLVLLGPVRGTQARWSESEALTGTAVRTGALDLRVDGQDALALPALSGTDLLPGAVLTRIVTISNAGSVPLTYTWASSGTDPDGRHLAAALDRSWRSVTGGACGSALPAGPRSLAPGASESVCLRIALPDDASASVAGSTTRLTFEVDSAVGGWTDEAPVETGTLTTMVLTTPAITCTPLSVSWATVPGATAYRILDAHSGAVLSTLSTGTLTQLLGGVFGSVEVQAVFGTSGWASAPSAACG
ncbi:hypothetical protein [Nocardioides mangrovi]|uniref:DUF11 domain-containing protein n=1 Tax=Nocardioides mangrovi TaxID=2874580 RepID=A0ABS7UCV7_9ACTN|nr:hypothetical protein [Nocardioides mangrovi]MBZ5738493.1 hypothetical protein [Nocardioides mangrovi]